MIIEYKDKHGELVATFQNVDAVETTRGGVTYLHGLTPADIDGQGILHRYAQPFLIAAINLAPGEYLEVVNEEEKDNT